MAAHVSYELSRNYILLSLTERELALLERSAAAARRTGDLSLLAASECSAAPGRCTDTIAVLPRRDPRRACRRSPAFDRPPTTRSGIACVPKGV